MNFASITAEDLYYPEMVKIRDVKTLTATEKKFVLELPDNRELGHRPGQFVEVSIFGFGEAPISICSSPTRGPYFELTVRATGRLTDKLHALSPGDYVGIRGPFGNGFDVEKYYGADMLFVCGGIGLAPLKSFIDFTLDNRGSFGRVIILYGAKHPDEILFKDDIENWQNRPDVEFLMTVDRPSSDWRGRVGVITTLIPDLDINSAETQAMVVGPPVMYKFVLMALKGKRIPDENIWMSLERRMKCGVGKCGHCQINDTYVCQDGPVYHFPRIKQLEEAI